MLWLKDFKLYHLEKLAPPIYRNVNQECWMLKLKPKKGKKLPPFLDKKNPVTPTQFFLFIKQKDLVYVTPVYQAVQNLKVIV